VANAGAISRRLARRIITDSAATASAKMANRDDQAAMRETGSSFKGRRAMLKIVLGQQARLLSQHG
jgi:hypothetical protein